MEVALVDVVEQVKRRVGVESRGRLAESLKVARAGYRGCQQRNRGGDVRRSEDGRRTWETTSHPRTTEYGVRSPYLGPEGRARSGEKSDVIQSSNVNLP